MTLLADIKGTTLLRGLGFDIIQSEWKDLTSRSDVVYQPTFP